VTAVFKAQSKLNRIAGPDPITRALDKKIGPGSLVPDVPDAEATPEPPTLDEAKKRRDYTDRLRRRRGVLATIFGGGGASSSSPKVGVAQLLGG
jgi:hypothetical protein